MNMDKVNLLHFKNRIKFFVFIAYFNLFERLKNSGHIKLFNSLDVIL